MRRKKKKIRDGPLVHIEEKVDPDTQLDIISRLPFKEAVRCRLVCKSWRFLLDDNILINNHPKTPLKLNSHHHHAHNNYSYSSSRLSFISTPYLEYDNDDDGEDIIFGVYDDDYDMCSYKESRSSFKYPSTSSVRTLQKKPSSVRNARTISSCNGLICLTISNSDFQKHPTENMFLIYSIVIYNPITKEKLNILTYNGGFLWGYVFLTCASFGYHPLTKQYKILRCSYDKYDCQEIWFEIYTLGTTGGKWRQIKSPEDPPNFDYHVPGVHVNGVLYWITNYFKNKKKRMIISLDLGDDEEFRIVTSLPPPHPNINKKQESSLHYKLKESLGCLYLIVDYPSYMEIWLMMKKEKKRRMPEKTETTKKYKRDHRHHYSWTKVMKIGTDHRRKGEYEFAGLTKSGKVLFGYNGVLTCFDPKTKIFESLSSSSGACRRTFVPHVNSLVSPMSLQSTATTGEDISKVCTYNLLAEATTTGKMKWKYVVEEVYEKFV